jgi:hypothetical protein
MNISTLHSKGLKFNYVRRENIIIHLYETPTTSVEETIKSVARSKSVRVSMCACVCGERCVCVCVCVCVCGVRCACVCVFVGGSAVDEYYG